jgi:hypothetical protein
MPKASKTDQQSSEGRNAPSLLNPQQYMLCKQLAVGKPPWSQRAKALLAINDGASEAVASELSQLRSTQVKFWLNKFNKEGIDIFPEPLLQDMDDISDTSTENAPGEVLPTDDDTDESKKLKKTNKAKGKNKNKNAGAKKNKRSREGKKVKSANRKPKKKM